MNLYDLSHPSKKKKQQLAMESRLAEFAPPGGDDGGPDEDEILFKLAKQWWLGTEQDMIRVERTLASMGWEIGEDEGSYDDGGVFVVRAGDVNGKSYQSWPHEELVTEGATVTTTPGSVEPGGAVDNFKQQMANNTELAYQKKQQGMAEGDTVVKHRIGLTVTDPNHPMASKRNEPFQRTVRVPGDDPAKAINAAIAHYRRKGYKVHDHHYMGTVDYTIDEAAPDWLRRTAGAATGALAGVGASFPGAAIAGPIGGAVAGAYGAKAGYDLGADAADWVYDKVTGERVPADKTEVDEALTMKHQRAHTTQRRPDISNSLADRDFDMSEKPNVAKSADGHPTVKWRHHGHAGHTRVEPTLNPTTVQRKDTRPIPSFLKKGMAEDAENFNGIELSMKIQLQDVEYVDDEDYDNQVIYVTASSNGRELGHVLFSFDGEYLMPQDLEVEEKYRGQGIAQTMYDYVKSKGYKIRRSGQQTDAGAGFWDKHKPGKNVWEQGVAEGSLNEFAPDGFNGDDDEGFSPEIAKMAYDAGSVKGVSLADGATLARAMAITEWDKQDGGIYTQHFAKGFKAGRMNKINHHNKQYNLNLKLMKDGSIRRGQQGVAEGSLEEDEYDKMLRDLLKARPDLTKKYAKDVQKSKDIESGKELNKLVKKNPGVLKTYSDAVKRDKKLGVAEGGYRQGFADPNAPSLGGSRRKDDEGNSEFDDRQRRQTGMIFYKVDDAELAQQLGLKQTRAGKWYLRTGNRHAQQTADRAFGLGRIWYPKNETVESEELGELSNELLGRYKKELGIRASAADRAGNFDKGHEYFKKINRATVRQGDNDARRHAEKENDVMETRLNMMRKAGYDL
jgi:GNAT superfamily N-acetyltransferase